MLVISNSLAPFGELEDARVLDYLFIWNSGKTSTGYRYGYAIVTNPTKSLVEYRDEIRDSVVRRTDSDLFDVWGYVKDHDRTLPIWSLILKIMKQLDMNTPRLQWHLSRKGMYP